MVDLATCRSCPRLVSIDEDPHSAAGVVHCTPPVAAEADHVSSCQLTRDVMSVRDDVSLQELTSFFVQQGLPRVAVVDADGILVGIVTERDLVLGDVLEQRHLGDVPAATLVRHEHSVTEVTTLRDALRVMARHHLREVPVVGEDGQFAGWLEDLSALHALRRA